MGDVEDFREAGAINLGLAGYPEEKAGLKQLQVMFRLRSPWDVVRKLVRRHRRIPREIKAQFHRARKVRKTA